MSYYKILIVILIIFLKTGNVLSLEKIFNVNNIEIKHNIKNKEISINEAFKEAFDRLIKIKGKIVSRKILPLSLSYDHRLIDGAEGARFCVYLGKCLGKDFAFKLAV